jgi:hypothetical protein
MELRPSAEIAAMIDHVGRHGYGNAEYARGLLAALHWVVGTTATSPIGTVVLNRPVTATDVYHEQDRAYEAMSPLAEPELREVLDYQGREYVTAVEHTLDWAIGGTGLTTPPR